MPPVTALREMRVTYAPVSEVAIAREALRMPADVFRIVGPILDVELSEVFGVLLMDTRHHVMAWSVVGRGGLSSVTVEPRELFRSAILGNAAAIVAVHNHPSGDPAPSADDSAMTARLVAAGELLGVPVLDHVIIGCGTGKYYSFKEAHCIL